MTTPGLFIIGVARSSAKVGVAYATRGVTIMAVSRRSCRFYSREARFSPGDGQGQPSCAFQDLLRFITTPRVIGVLF
jgi:hypothetical protein